MGVALPGVNVHGAPNAAEPGGTSFWNTWFLTHAQYASESPPASPAAPKSAGYSRRSTRSTSIARTPSAMNGSRNGASVWPKRFAR